MNITLINKKITILTCFILLLILPGCLSILKQQNNQSPSLFELNMLYDKHLTNLVLINSWRLSAKMQIKTSKECSKVLLTWKQNNKNYHIHATGPLGVNIADITGSNNYINVKFSDQIKTSVNPSLLLAEITGINIPFDSLEYWVKGMPDPDYLLEKKLNNQGYISELQQLGYTIKYNNYKKFNKKIFPTKIQIITESFMITIIIDKWKIL